MLQSFTPGARVEFHNALNLYSVATNKVTLHLVTGPRELTIDTAIDNVISVKIVQLPNTAALTVFIFGRKAVSVVGVNQSGEKYFGVKEFAHPIAFVDLISQVTQADTEVLTFMIGGQENATFEQMKVTVKKGFGPENLDINFNVKTIFQTTDNATTLTSRVQSAFGSLFRGFQPQHDAQLQEQFRNRVCKDIILLKNETQETYNRCLVITASDVFILNLMENGALTEQRCFLQATFEEYTNRLLGDSKTAGDRIERIDFASCHLSIDEEANQKLNIFMTIKVRKYGPASYTHDLRTVLGLYQKTFGNNLPEQMSFYEIEEIVPDTTYRPVVNKAWSGHSVHDAELCLLQLHNGYGLLVELNPYSRLKSTKEINVLVLSAQFDRDLRIFVQNDILVYQNINASTFSIIEQQPQSSQSKDYTAPLIRPPKNEEDLEQRLLEMISAYYEIKNIKHDDDQAQQQFMLISQELQGYKQICEPSMLAQSLRNIIATKMMDEAVQSQVVLRSEQYIADLTDESFTQDSDGLILAHLERHLKQLQTVKQFVTEFIVFADELMEYIETCFEKVTAAIVVRQWQNQNRPANKFIQRAFKMSVNQGLKIDDFQLKKQGTTYTHVVFSNLTRFEEVLRALTTPPSSLQDDRIVYNPQSQDELLYSCQVILDVFRYLKHSVMLTDPTLLHLICSQLSQLKAQPELRLELTTFLLSHLAQSSLSKKYMTELVTSLPQLNESLDFCIQYKLYKTLIQLCYRSNQHHVYYPLLGTKMPLHFAFQVVYDCDHQAAELSGDLTTYNPQYTGCQIFNIFQDYPALGEFLRDKNQFLFCIWSVRNKQHCIGLQECVDKSDLIDTKRFFASLAQFKDNEPESEGFIYKELDQAGILKGQPLTSQLLDLIYSRKPDTFESIRDQFLLIEASQLQSTLLNQEFARLFKQDHAKLVQIGQQILSGQMRDHQVKHAVSESYLYQIAQIKSLRVYLEQWLLDNPQHDVYHAVQTIMSLSQHYFKHSID